MKPTKLGFCNQVRRTAENISSRAITDARARRTAAGAHGMAFTFRGARNTTAVTAVLHHSRTETR
jgi:hypothetical protein